ncbi:MAG: RluA family pseudouridine synthase [Lachnospiraceae bacterium]|nr:RluA family pseudouridine synthase [Lachnospiraceae bacterium]
MILTNITSNEAGQRFDKYLKKLLKDAPDSFIYKMLRKKNIILNGKKADGKEILCGHDEVKLFLSDDTFQKFSGNTTSSSPETLPYEQAYAALKTLDIVYEDEHVLVVNKPSGVLSQKANPADISVNEWLIGYLLTHKKLTPDSLLTFKPSICNRLDRNTSGMVVCGKTLAGSQYMNRIIKDKSLQKYYYCLVWGTVAINERITGYLYKDTRQNKVTVYKREADIPESRKKEADFIDTSVHSVREGKHLTMLEVQLFTGKTHQIRAHLASIGHPILGDMKYGDEAANRKYVRKDVKNQMLHAHKLIFPVNSEQHFAQLSGKVLECPPPAIFQNLLEEE